MALQAGFLVPADAVVASVTVAAGAASGEIVTGTNLVLAMNATQDVTITFGQSGMAAPTASSFRVPAGTTIEVDMGQNHDRYRVFNIGTASAIVYTQLFSRF
jgi:uncharacterized cupredoxin-like copper-binding protein